MNLANKLSILRILIIPFFVAFMVYYTPEKDYIRFWALAFFSLAVLSDAVDGFVARVKGEKTVLGSIIDPLADKLLLTTCFVTLSIADKFPFEYRLPPWLPIAVISRDVILVIGAVIIHMGLGNLQISPNKLGKVTTFFQMLTIIWVLLKMPYLKIIFYITVFLTIISGLIYIANGSRLLNQVVHINKKS